MYVRREIDLDTLHTILHGQALSRWNNATMAQKREVWSLIESAFEGADPTDSKVNDFVWFDCDHIFFPEEEEEEEEEEETDESCKQGQCRREGNAPRKVILKSMRKK